ncbi:cell wall-binding repeat-containing protein [Agromyces sp. LHK192]|uniref:cell wall-binding repeat-containing protein n=1 Tax=Agromyces sp. LHK192 TaxID=2498704 RepID=UPI000FDBB9D5|nr:cell wall-binding repeat-containing protein [Agromyces sp. LHK192]
MRSVVGSSAAVLVALLVGGVGWQPASAAELMPHAVGMLAADSTEETPVTPDRPESGPAAPGPTTPAPSPAPATSEPTPDPAAPDPATPVPTTHPPTPIPTPPGSSEAPPSETDSGSDAVPSESLLDSPMALSSATPFPPGAHRIGGVDRVETSVLISERFPPGVGTVYVATAAKFPDALSASAAAARAGGPVLLTWPDAVPESVLDEIVRLAPARIVVAGSEASISAAVVDQLTGLAGAVVRLGGADRFLTSELIVQDGFETATEVFLATGQNWPDAVAASAAAGSRGVPVLLVDGLATGLRPETVQALRALGAGTVRIAGSVASVSAGIEWQLIGEGFAVMRHEGVDRYHTAVAINEATFGSPPPSTFLATGENFPDALTGAALAGGLGSPMFLTRTACVPEIVRIAMNALGSGSRVVLGSAASVSDAAAAGTACPPPWTKPAEGRITDGFGPRPPICTPGGCTNSFHRGTDLGTGCWAPIYAATSGRVITARAVGTYGNYIRIDHGRIDTAYAHLADGGTLVAVGQDVATGQQIGWSGATGAATGCHLHFEVWDDGVQIDPVPFMAAQGVPLG